MLPSGFKYENMISNPLGFLMGNLRVFVLLLPKIITSLNSLLRFSRLTSEYILYKV